MSIATNTYRIPVTEPEQADKLAEMIAAAAEKYEDVGIAPDSPKFEDVHYETALYEALKGTTPHLIRRVCSILQAHAWNLYVPVHYHGDYPRDVLPVFVSKYPPEMYGIKLGLMHGPVKHVGDPYSIKWTVQEEE